MTTPAHDDRSDPRPSPTPQRHACDRCWKRKQKCDRLRPICTPCQQSDQPCQPRSTSVAVTAEYAEGETIDVPCGEGYIGALKRKISRLESLHAAKLRRIGPVTSRLPTPTRHVGDQRRGGDHDTSLRAALAEFRHLVLSSMAAEASSDLGQSPDTSLAALVLNAAVTMRDDRGSYQKVLDMPLHFVDVDCRPLLETYIDKVLWRYPIDDERSLRQSYDHTLQQHDHDGLLRPDVTEVHRVIAVYLNLACIAFSSSNISSRVFAGQLHTTAFRLLSKHGARIGPLRLTRCITSMAICSLFSSEAGLTWHLIGIAMSKAISLGLHQLPTTVENATTSEQDEESHRFFRVLYSIDRTISSATHCPVAIEAQDVSLHESNKFSKSSSANDYQLSRFDSLLDHSQLMDFLRPNKLRPMAYYLGAYYAWHHKTPLRHQATKSQVGREVYLRCCCRALVQLLQVRQESPIDNLTCRTWTTDMEIDALETFQQWLECIAEVYDMETVLPAWIDAHDIVNVGTMILNTSNEHQGQKMIIRARCDALLGRLVDRFPSAKTLRSSMKAYPTNTPS